MRVPTFGSIIANFVAATSALFTFHTRRVTFKAIVSSFEVLSTTLKFVK